MYEANAAVLLGGKDSHVGNKFLQCNSPGKRLAVIPNNVIYVSY